jgi:hypothetical protein
MKKTLIILSCVILAGTAQSAPPPSSSVKLTTSYTSPLGQYKNLYTTFLKIIEVEASDPLTPGCDFGTLAIDTDDKLKFCSITNTWLNLSEGIWTKNELPELSYLYPSIIDSITDHYWVGIGTDTPKAKLHISSEGYLPVEPPEGSYTGLRLDMYNSTQTTYAVAELRAHSILKGRTNVVSLWSGQEGGGFTPDYRMSITEEGSTTLYDDFLELPEPQYAPTLHVQRNLTTVGPSAGPLMTGNLIDGSKLAAIFSFNRKDAKNLPLASPTNPMAGDAIGIGFSADELAPVSVGAAIIHERRGGFSAGRLHFATKPIAALVPITLTSPLLIRMTIDSFGNLGLGTPDPAAKFHLVGSTLAEQGVHAGYKTTEMQIDALDNTAQLAINSPDTSQLILTGTPGADQALGEILFNNSLTGTTKARLIGQDFGAATSFTVNFGGALNLIYFNTTGSTINPGQAGAITFFNEGSNQFESVVTTPSTGTTHSRMIRGAVNSIGNIIAASTPNPPGFSSAKNAGLSGTYTITFSGTYPMAPPNPTPVVTPIFNGADTVVASVMNLSNTTFQVKIWRVNPGPVALFDNAFTFMVIGTK